MTLHVGFEKLESEEVLKRAIKFEHSKLTKLAFQKTNAATAAGTSTSYRRKNQARAVDGRAKSEKKYNETTVQEGKQ